MFYKLQTLQISLFFSVLKLDCQVSDRYSMSLIDVVIQADLETDEVYAQMTLIPVPPAVSI